MKSIIAALSLASTLTAASTVVAQDNPAVDNFDARRFASCYSGRDIGALTRVSNPLLLLGSLTYVGPVMGESGASATGWVREPMSLPITTSESTSPDTATCTVKFETVTGGNVSFLGFSTNASAGDVYEATVRLISRQAIAPVAEGNANVSAWRSSRYRDQFRSVISSAAPDITTFYLFDNISIYLLDVKRYQRRAAGGFLNFGLFSGGVNYDRVDNFSGSKLIITGDPVVLTRASYNLPVLPPTVTVTSQPVTGDRAIQALTAGELNSIRSGLLSLPVAGPQ